MVNDGSDGRFQEASKGSKEEMQREKKIKLNVNGKGTSNSAREQLGDQKHFSVSCGHLNHYSSCRCHLSNTGGRTMV